MREHLVMPSIGSGDVACAEWPNIRRFEHFLYLLNLVNDAFNLHSSQYLTQARQGSNGAAAFRRTSSYTSHHSPKSSAQSCSHSLPASQQPMRHRPPNQNAPSE